MEVEVEEVEVEMEVEAKVGVEVEVEEEVVEMEVEVVVREKGKEVASSTAAFPLSYLASRNGWELIRGRSIHFLRPKAKRRER